MIHWKPYIVLGYMVFEEIFKEISETGRKRIAKHLKMSADAYIQENKLLRVDGGLKFKSVEEMLQVSSLEGSPIGGVGGNPYPPVERQQNLQNGLNQGFFQLNLRLLYKNGIFFRCRIIR